MRFFIDTANLDQIKEAKDLGILDGVTTNPSLMAKEGISGKNNQLKRYKDICDIVEGDVSAEVISTDYAGMIKEGIELSEIAPNIVVKIPMIKDGVKAISTLTEKGISTNFLGSGRIISFIEYSCFNSGLDYFLKNNYTFYYIFLKIV